MLQLRRTTPVAPPTGFAGAYSANPQFRERLIMQREYHKWHSPILGRDMELLLFGTGGRPVIAFSTSFGRFYQNEDFGLIAAVSDKLDRGELQIICVDSVDEESWYNRGVPPGVRAARHNQY